MTFGQVRPLSPDSPIPQFSFPHVYDIELSRHRSFTPESTFSDWEGTDLCLETLFDENRPESPQSVLSDFELDKLFSSRALSPESVSSDFDFSLIQDWLLDFRASSPEYVVSAEQWCLSPPMTFGQVRPLSPDSPIPQFSFPHVYDMELSRHRSFTPESTFSDWEGTDLCLETLFDENRPESPQSVSSDFELDKLFSSRALSPESVSSDLDFSLIQDWLLDFRASSPESVVSFDQRCLYPRMTFGQINSQHCNYYLQYSESRPVSPISTTSDVEYSGFYLEDLFDDSRPDSPDSFSSQIENKQTGVTVTTSPPLSAARPYTYADIVRGITHEKHADAFLGVRSFELRPLWPMSVSSEKEYTHSSVDECVTDLRPHSPESVSSQSELRHLSPDSPVPQFRCPHDWLLDFRASSPEYVVSAEQWCLSPPMTFGQDWLLDFRASSPEYVVSAEQWCLSPPMTFGQDWLLDFRASSPEYVVSAEQWCLSPPMTFGQDWLLDFRASSPEYVVSAEQWCLSPPMTFGQ
ncbi:uncharacterized protein LOC127359928, partial [Dicentrarchus labrax]|uniref:uncharacterized protein LOC127359928 n=1 Tax=Dicentrarchus labrax TaxID=13489 RepID=UPI0021F5143B